MTKIKIEGLAEIKQNSFHCVCGHCGHTDDDGARMEFNFKEQRVIYLCGKCKKENTMIFGQLPPPYPRTSIGR